MDIENLISDILDCANIVRKALSPGYTEKVYENALMIELSKAGISAKQQSSIIVKYDDKVVGEFIADIFVENCVIIELKAVQNINEAHQAQLVNYLTATGIDNGLLINFGNENKIQIRRKYRVYRPKE
ncbi:MAG: GxxExxY protein [Muribaculaceae bacterium]|nr:GxxExxY protein [Muribaculaceae bacterium]